MIYRKKLSNNKESASTTNTPKAELGFKQTAKRIISWIIMAVMTISLIIPLASTASAEELMRLEEYPVTINDNEYDGASVLGAYTNGYDNHMYFSIRDLANLLNGSEKQFNFYLDWEQDGYVVEPGLPYAVAEEAKAIAAEQAAEAERRAAAYQLAAESQGQTPVEGETADGNTAEDNEAATDVNDGEAAAATDSVQTSDNGDTAAGTDIPADGVPAADADGEQQTVPLEGDKGTSDSTPKAAAFIFNDAGEPIGYEDGYIEKYPYWEDGAFKQNFRTNRQNEDGEWIVQRFDGDYYDEDGNLRDRDDNVVMVFYPDPVERPDLEYLDLYINPLKYNGEDTRYYTLQLSLTEDLYMNFTDMQLMFGITMVMDPHGILHVYTDRGFDVDLQAYNDDGYFDLFNGVVLGDATTGEILYGCKADNMDAIASTSKLMTYMVVARYLELGRIHLDDVVTISENVQNLAYSGYGTLYMDAGQEVTVSDLLGALLLASSNESGLALAEYIAGSESAFVTLMNKMAELLGLDSAQFYNSNGLPVYSSSLIASKCQNHMSAADLFRLASAVLRKYPAVTDYTSQKWMYLPSFDYSVSNTNYLLYNMPESIGMKTGTTDEAGCCLVAAKNVETPDGVHTLVAVVLGAESNIDRYQVPALLLTWGAKHIQ